MTTHFFPTSRAEGRRRGTRQSVPKQRNFCWRPWLGFLLTALSCQVRPPAVAAGPFQDSTLPIPTPPGETTVFLPAAGVTPSPSPSAPAAGKEQPLSGTAKIFVRDFIFTGNTIFSAAQLLAVAEAAGYPGNREFSAEELHDLRKCLTRHYIDHGYVNSGVVIPDQQLRDNVVTFQVIEGRLTDIAIRGNDRLSETYLKERLLLAPDTPFNVQQALDRLQVLRQDRLLKTIHAQFVPTGKLGEGLMQVEVEEARPYWAGIRFSNHRSPAIGSDLLEGSLEHGNLSGWGDSLLLQYGLTAGADNYSLTYSIPVTSGDTRLKAYYARNDALVIEEPFNKLDIDSDSTTVGWGLSHPLFRAAEQELVIGLDGEKRKSTTRLLGEPFSFSAGVVDGESRVTALRFFEQWVKKNSKEVIAARFTANLGIDAFAPTDSGEKPDGRFFSWLGQLQWVKRLSEPLTGQLLFRTSMQLTADKLLPLEKFALCGAATVRGYRENELVRDNGLAASFEARVHILRLPLGPLSKNPADGSIQLCPFVDLGRGWDRNGQDVKRENLASIGAGIRWDPSERIHGEIYWGHPLEQRPRPDNDWQDDGLHFLVSFTY